MKGAAAAVLATLSKPSDASAAGNSKQAESAARQPPEASFQFFRVVDPNGRSRTYTWPALTGTLARATTADLMFSAGLGGEPQKPTMDVSPLDPRDPISPDTPVKYIFQDRVKGRVDLVLPGGLSNMRNGAVNFYMNHALLQNYAEDTLGGTINLKGLVIRLELNPRSKGWKAPFVRLFSLLALFDPVYGSISRLNSKAIGVDFLATNGFHYAWNDSEYHNECFWDHPRGMIGLPVFDNLLEMESNLIVPLASP